MYFCQKDEKLSVRGFHLGVCGAAVLAQHTFAGIDVAAHKARLQNEDDKCTRVGF